MSGFEEYGKHDAVSLAALVNSGEISETELLDESLPGLVTRQHCYGLQDNWNRRCLGLIADHPYTLVDQCEKDFCLGEFKWM